MRKRSIITAAVLATFVAGTAVVHWIRSPRLTPELRGYALARDFGCFNCHGPDATGGVPNPGSEEVDVPAWDGGTAMMYVEKEDEIREWIMDGHPKRLAHQHGVAFDHDNDALLTASGLGSGRYTFLDGDGATHWLDRLVAADLNGDGIPDDPVPGTLPAQVYSVSPVVSTTHTPLDPDSGLPPPGALDLPTIRLLREANGSDRHGRPSVGVGRYRRPSSASFRQSFRMFTNCSPIPSSTACCSGERVRLRVALPSRMSTPLALPAWTCVSSRIQRSEKWVS